MKPYNKNTRSILLLFTKVIFLLFGCTSLFAQRENHLAFPEVDSLYREDQFYIGGTFQIISDRPTDVVQSGFSGGLHLGFIRDFPINKRRNVALGIGIGYSANVYNHNLVIEEIDDTVTYRVQTSDDNFSINRFRNQIIEVPLQLRWRTSTPESYKFWRVYAGARLGYMHAFSYQTETESGERNSIRGPQGLNRLRAGATLTFGFNTFNFHLYYGLTPFFDATTTGGESVGFNTIQIGLMFYIL